VAQQKDETAASSGTPRIDLNQSLAAMARQFADSQQEIEELKTQQAQILSDNSGLDRRLKEAQELARSNADLIKELKSAQTQMAQDNADLAAQVKASQEQVTKLAAQLDAASQTQVAKVTAQIKAGQDHNAPLLEQKQRPKLSIPVSARASSPPKRLAPKPRLQPAKPLTEDPPETQ
jgi:chromosome segregation ATPase